MLIGFKNSIILAVKSGYITKFPFLVPLIPDSTPFQVVYTSWCFFLRDIYLILQAGFQFHPVLTNPPQE